MGNNPCLLHFKTFKGFCYQVFLLVFNGFLSKFLIQKAQYIEPSLKVLLADIILLDFGSQFLHPRSVFGDQKPPEALLLHGIGPNNNRSVVKWFLVNCFTIGISGSENLLQLRYLPWNMCTIDRSRT